MTNTQHRYEPLWVKPHHRDKPDAPGIKKLYGFENGYGASVVRFEYSYGYREGLWELAVVTIEIDEDGPHVGDLIYDTPITDDVIGHLTEDEVDVLVARIAALPPRSQEPGDV